MLFEDGRRLQQILINLVGNSIKFTTAGSVHVRLYRMSPDLWAMQVTDTGAGIPKEAQAYIFEPFRQLDNSVTRASRGTGLGLSITKQLVELMEGEIHVESEPGQGSTFTVTLPILPGPEHTS
jgi:two-component system capsular synthesis sensor histidine kinase RcsC